MVDGSVLCASVWVNTLSVRTMKSYFFLQRVWYESTIHNKHIIFVVSIVNIVCRQQSNCCLLPYNIRLRISSSSLLLFDSRVIRPTLKALDKFNIPREKTTMFTTHSLSTQHRFVLSSVIFIFQHIFTSVTLATA